MTFAVAGWVCLLVAVCAGTIEQVSPDYSLLIALEVGFAVLTLVLFALAAARCGRLGRVLVGLSSVVPVLLLVDGVVRAV